MYCVLIVLFLFVTQNAAASKTSSQELLEDLEIIDNYLNFNKPNPMFLNKEPDARYFLYTKDDNEIEFTKENLTNFPSTYKNYMFVVHGWTSNRDTPWIRNITKAILTNKDNAVVQVDWRRSAKSLYSTACIEAKKIGASLATYIATLNAKKKIDLDRVTLIGFSLGGHIIGFAGKSTYEKLNKKIGRIISLDPAGPIFNSLHEDARLNKNDGDCVVVLHTDRGKFGYRHSFGALDFFANTGYATQPGCWSIEQNDIIPHGSVADIVGCSHQRAPIYLIEAIKIAYTSTSFNNYSVEKHKFLRAISGDCNIEPANYFFTTNSEPPYL